MLDDLSQADRMIENESIANKCLEVIFFITVHDHVDGPSELFPLGLVVDLLDGDGVLLAPGHGYPGVQVVQLAGAQSDSLIFILVCPLDLQLLQLLHQPLQGLLALVQLGLAAASILVSLLGGLELLLRLLDGVMLVLNLLSKVLHGLVEGFGDCTL